MNIKRIPYGKNRPLGRMKKFMEFDLKEGYIGHLDELLPELIVNDDLYGEKRRTMIRRDVDLGLRYIAGNLGAEYMWWASEGQGNWMDGFVRTAFITDVPEMREKCEKFVKHYLDTVDEDGYIGIYKEGSRFVEGYEGGELWAQSTILRALTAYYEYTGREDILTVIRNALDRIMLGYPQGKSRPFSAVKDEEGTSCGGLSHGLTITDTFYFMYKETGEQKYIDYAVWLYESASAEPIFHSDIPLPRMLDENWKLKYHGVHSYEHIRALAIAKFFGHKPEFTKAYENYLKKVEPCITPTGGPTGNEWILEHYADATEYAYEYCSIHEFFHSLEFLFELSGDLSFTDRAEHLLYNAAFGAHHPTESSITYLKTDNCYNLVSSFKEKDRDVPTTHFGYKYSPTHQDTAVCCIPNAGRVFPHFVANQWYETDEGLLRVFYGASELDTEIEGTKVKITENSDYPFCGKLSYRVVCDGEKEFTLAFKIPAWCKDFTLSCDYVHEGRLIKITKVWKDDSFDIDFKFSLEKHRDLLGDSYFTYGPMVLAVAIPSEDKIVKTHPVKGFYDKEIRPLDTKFENVSLVRDEAYFEDGKIYADLVQNETGERIKGELIPMSETILRRITFPVKE